MENTPKAVKPTSVYASTSSPVSNVSRISTSLKERLKRTRRSFTSPFLVAKRLKVETEDDGHPLPTDADKMLQSNQIDGLEMASDNKIETTPGENPVNKCIGSQNTTPLPSATVQTTETDIVQIRDKLKREVKARAETLRRLKMVKMYRTKNDLAQLQRLIDKWRKCSQAVLYKLQSDLLIDGQKASLSQLIDHLGLEENILHFDRREEDFTVA